MYKKLLSCVAAVCAAVAGVSSRDIYLADPTIYVEGGRYYMTGTMSPSSVGFPLLVSDNLTEWRDAGTENGLALRGDGVSTFGSGGFWAPHIVRDTDGVYSMYYTADEQVAVARCGTVAGRYAQESVGPIDGSEHNIDPFLFRDDDGRVYLYHVRFDCGNYIWVGEYDESGQRFVPGTLQRCFVNTQAWERTDAYPCDPIMEGPTVMKLDGMYYMFYSANHFESPDYAVGYAVARSPLGPWTKYAGNPIISRDVVGEKGSGHGDVFRIDGETLRLGYVYHVHNSDARVSPRRTRILMLELKPDGDGGYVITAEGGSVIVPRQVD